ncbi:nitroreductase family protein [Agrilactobacillus yilanensis]|uniref:Nitroreductase family protein n=1 Tax=Agrilactobacillus yilanensis TaxID=2485997 RepID=A0ABW4J9F7_9LACO|nr:nitroreductase family protein [Agrilactobacillus yilanensis]
MSSQYLDLIRNRRTIYALGKNISQTPDEIVTLVEQAVEHAPSAFNNQTSRVVFLFNEHHDKLWDLTADRLHTVVPDEKAFENTKNKLMSFKAGFGTILYFTDTEIVKNFENQFPLYAENFADWAEQNQGSTQFNVWTTLANENIGASLQHYNPLIDTAVKQAFNIPDQWQLRAEMPFGSIENPAGDKDFMAKTDRFKVFK